MPRSPRNRQWTEAACYHVMNRGHNPETLFAQEQDFAYFLQRNPRFIARYQKRLPLRLYHYCLLSNHFHLLLQLADPRPLSRLMAGLLRSFVHYFNRRYGFVAHLFQGRFQSLAIEAEGYLLSCGRYIEGNPVEAGLVTEAWQYRWSSCRAYAWGEPDDRAGFVCSRIRQNAGISIDTRPHSGECGYEKLQLNRAR